MGVKNLNSLINKYANSAINKTYLWKYKNQKAAIDANLYLYKYSYGNNNTIDGFFFQINKLKKFNIQPIYIFDGKPPKEKNLTIIMRKKNKQKLKNKIELLHKKIELLNKSNIENNLKIEQIKEIEKKIYKYEKSLIYITKELIEKIKCMLDLMGVIYIDAPCESEHFCCQLIKNNLVDIVISEDMDTLACGANIVLKDFSNKSDYVLEYDFNKILVNMKLSKKEFIDLCILLGNDYVNRIKKYNPCEIYDLILKYKNIEKINHKFNNIVKYNYNNLRNIYNLMNIDISSFNINNHIPVDILKIKNFLELNSNIRKAVYNKRLNFMFSKKNLYKSRYITNLQIKNKI
jgi:flap endonuclease-1